MIPFESLYGSKCNFPVNWDKVIIGEEMLRDMKEQIGKVRNNLKVVHEKNKIYTDKGRTSREFQVGNHM